MTHLRPHRSPPSPTLTSVPTGRDGGLTRRQFGAMAGSALAWTVVGPACRRMHAGSDDDGRIAARPHAGITTTAAGERALGLRRRRDAILKLPSKPADATLPLLVLLHGAGGSGAGVLRRV